MTAPVRLVLAGGGHSHVEVLRQFAMYRVPTLSITLIARDALMPYSGMLPGFIAGHYAYDECHIDVRNLAHMAGARFCLAEVEGIDLDKKHVFCAGRPPIPFDLLSLNVGARPAMDALPGARERAWPAKPVDAFIRNWQALKADLGTHPRPHRIVTVGAGAGGVELTLAMQQALRAVTPEVHFTILSATRDILPTHNAKVRKKLEAVLNARGVEVHRGETAVAVLDNEVQCASGRHVPFDTLVWATHVEAAPWLRDSGLAVDEDGFVAVDDALRSTSHSFVFAAGDVASLASNPRPKSGVYAVREAPVLARNVYNTALGRLLEPYRPQKNHLGLLSTGDRYAIASRGAWSAAGRWVWRWKDRIDRKWMNRYRYVVPSMSGIATGMVTGRYSLGDAMEMEMPCAGCGAKLGQAPLERALARIGSAHRADVLIGLEAPDDAAVIDPPPGKLAVHTVDFFPPLIEDAFLAGKIAAVHCLSDIYAMGATPHTALAMVTLPPNDAQRTEDDLADVLAGAQSVLAPEHTALVGGHTLLGDTMVFGLSVNGHLDRARLDSERKPSAGDAILMTKPLGIGTIFAADMRGIAQNDWLTDALAVMTQSNADAARILFDHGATACTDVTGFGLAGHLLRVLRQHACGAELQLARVPVLQGALAANEMEVRSSLYPANAEAQQALQASDAVKSSVAYPLLFDPQTAGGFVAAVPVDRAAACLAALHAAGYGHAAHIGVIRAGNDASPRITVA